MNGQRVVFGSGQRAGSPLVPEILEVGWGHFVAADSGHLPPHVHPGSFEICLILSGEVEWETRTGAYVLHEGDVYLTQPDEVHWGRDAAMHPCTLYWLILGSPQGGVEWPQLEPELADYLEHQIRNIHTHRLRGTPGVQTALEGIFEEHQRESGPLLVRRGRVRAHLHALLIELVRTHQGEGMFENPDRTGCTLSPDAARALDVLHSHRHDPRVMRRIRSELGSPLHKINRQFIEHFGTSIAQYWLRERVRLSRQRLRSSEITITDLASELGFSSSQHFATVFKKMTGMTPSQYRNAHASLCKRGGTDREPLSYEYIDLDQKAPTGQYRSR